VTVVPAGIVIVAGPKLKLSILTVASSVDLSTGLIAKLGMVPWTKARAATTVAANPKINRSLFISDVL
jgi:hypothetical protein